MASPFPYPPTDGQVFDHPNGIEYVWSDATKTWNIVYGSATNTGSLPLLNPASIRALPNSVPEVPPGTIVQADYNQWLFDALQHVNSEANIQVQPAPGPTDPDEGRLWYDSDAGKLYLYYNDGSSTQWVEVGGGGDIDLSDYATQADVDAADGLLQDQIDSALTTQAGIQTEQGVQNNQINALETQIQLLAQTQAAGKWTYERNITTSVRPPNTATFYGTHVDDVTTVLTDWSDLRLIMVDKTDMDGTTYTFSNFEAGDKIEILATDGSSACFGTVSNDPNNDSYGNMIVTVERSSGGPTEGKEYILSVYRPGANGGDVDLDVLDGRYVSRTGSNMIGDAYIRFSGGGLSFKHTDDSKKAYIYNATDTVTQWTAYNGTSLKVTARDGDPGSGRTFIDIKNADNNGIGGDDSGYRMKLYHVADPTADLHAANRRYVDGKVSDYLPLAGGTLTGNVTLNGGGLYTDSIIKSIRNSGYAFQVKPDDSGDATAFIHTNGNAEFANVKVEAAPTAASDLTNKEYVDSNFVKQTSRPGLRFKYEDGSGSPSAGKFKLYNESGIKLRINGTTDNGIPWAVDTPNADINFSEGHMFTIWASVNGSDNWRIKRVGTIRKIVFNNTDVLCHVDFTVDNGSFSAGSAVYNITIAGLI